MEFYKIQKKTPFITFALQVTWHLRRRKPFFQVDITTKITNFLEMRCLILLSIKRNWIIILLLCMFEDLVKLRQILFPVYHDFLGRS